MQALDLLRSVPLALSLHLSRLKYAYLAVLIAVLLILGAVWSVFFAAPRTFPSGTYLTVSPGTTVAAEARTLREQHFISSALLFKLLVRMIPGAHGVQGGMYVFTEPTGILTIAWNLTHGISGIPTTRITFPEGTTVRQMGSMLAARLHGFDEQAFDRLALGRASTYEGYLFPDTYFFLPGTTEQQAIDIMHSNYAVHTKKYAADFSASVSREREVITMASLLEGEGKTPEDKRIIAGILWKRLSLGMPLQVDAAFGYIYGVTGYTPTAQDLASNSAYNTYRRKGLPPTPINNPGDVSIAAALDPEKTDYLYYLTGTDGTMHYAKTYAEHVANTRKYLK